MPWLPSTLVVDDPLASYLPPDCCAPTDQGRPFDAQRTSNYMRHCYLIFNLDSIISVLVEQFLVTYVEHPIHDWNACCYLISPSPTVHFVQHIMSFVPCRFNRSIMYQVICSFNCDYPLCLVFYNCLNVFIYVLPSIILNHTPIPQFQMVFLLF